MSQGKWVETALFPYAVFLQCVPILALVPLIGFWFGFDLPARVIVCVMISLFPIVSNTLFGLQSVDPAQRELFRLQGASRWTVLTKLQLPAAAPAIFAGLRISAGLSVIGALVGDFFFQQGTPGLGALINQYQQTVASAELFAAIVVASLFGVLVFLFFGWMARLAIGKWYDFE
jgi:NitT/TauT family transport system permease protein